MELTGISRRTHRGTRVPSGTGLGNLNASGEIHRRSGLRLKNKLVVDSRSGWHDGGTILVVLGPTES
jgi:hypothetical protein